MDGRAVPKIWTSTDFGTWYRFSVRIFIETVRRTDFGTDPNLVRVVLGTVRILVRKIPNRNGFSLYGTWYGKKFRKIVNKYRVF